MSLNYDGKDKPLSKRAKPTFVVIGRRQYISSGRWNDDLMCEYVLKEGQKKWMPVGDLARVAYGTQSIGNKKSARKRLSSLGNYLLLRGHILLVERGHRAQIIRVKLYMGSALEREVALHQVEDLRRRREYSAEQYDRAIALLLPQAANESTAA